MEVILPNKLIDETTLAKNEFTATASEESMEALIKEYEAKISPKIFNTGGMFFLQLTNDKLCGIPITQVCQQQPNGSCPLVDCPCGNYRGGNGHSPSNTTASNSKQQETTQSNASKTQPEPLTLPYLIFKTQREMDDYDAVDMHHGDYSEQILKETFGLTDVSNKVSVYDFETLSVYSSGPYPVQLEASKKITQDEMAQILFDEFRDLSKVYSWHGSHKQVIETMITHMQENLGKPFSSPSLDGALRTQIEDDHSKNSSLEKIKSTLETYIDWEHKNYPSSDKQRLEEAIRDTILPKFNQWKDYTNGLVISVHDSWATHITLQSLNVIDNEFTATIHYRVQDHFGLDDGDLPFSVKLQRLFRIWFVLQRWEKLGFKPFITEMNATVTIEGQRQ